MIRRITVTGMIHRRPSGVDESGYPRSDKPVESWKKQEWPIFSIAPASMSEVLDGGRQPVKRVLRVSAPVDGPRPHPDDLVSLPGFEDGGMFTVRGEPQVWDKNPILATTLYRGIVVFLERSRR
ncbi:hypothetical protein ACTOVL_05940 [Arcanobacterium canis]